MPPQISVYAVPGVVVPEELSGGVAVVIDVLRASTTIAHALAAGATEVVPCLEIEDAWAAAEEIGRQQCVLGGERGGLPIRGFDLGNSPSEYAPERVAGKTVVFTTTNGTRTMMLCRRAAEVYIGAFVNAGAILSRLLARPAVHLLCAGSAGEVTRDDVLFAGMLVDRLQRASGAACRLNAQAVVARENWITAFPAPLAGGAEPIAPELLAQELGASLAGQKLASIGLESDILCAAEIDRLAIAPRLDPQTLRIRSCG